MRKNLFLIVLGIFASFSIIAKPALAFNSPESTYQLQFEDAVYRTEEMNLQSFVHEVVKALLASGMDKLIGCISCATPPGSGAGGGGGSGASSIPGPYNAGLIGSVAYAIDSVYKTKPVSGIEYVADLGAKFGIVKNTYAADYTGGLGFSQMRVILPIWTAFRNIAYVLFILVFVGTGFAIMFRIKIDPRTIVTIEMAIPKIILGLILVTFSYAIAGFLIDIMWIVNNLVLQVFKSLPGSPVFIDPNVPVTTGGGVMGYILSAGSGPFIWGSLILLVLGIVGLVAGFFTVGTSWVGAAICFAALILYVVVMFIALIRVLWSLIKAYTNVILQIIFAPFMLLAGSLPGSSTTGSWFKNILINLMALPIVLTMVLISNFLVTESIRDLFPVLLHSSINGAPVAQKTQYLATTDNSYLLAAALTPTPAPSGSGTIEEIGNALKEPNAGEKWPNLVLMLFVSLGVLLMTPKVVDMIQAALAGKPIQTGIGENLGPLPMLGGAGVAAAGGKFVDDRTTKTGPWSPTGWKNKATTAAVDAMSKGVGRFGK